MYIFRDNIAKNHHLELIIHYNPRGKLLGLNRFKDNNSKYTDITQTEGLKDALNKYNFNAAFGRARGDEEKSRSKERIYSFRDSFH